MAKYFDVIARSLHTRWLLTFLLAMGYQAVAAAQPPAANHDVAEAKPASEASQALRPSLLALSVGDLDASVAWYADMLGFTETARYEFSEDRMRLAFMEKDGFELELIEIADTPPFSAPDPNNPATRRGLVKFAFHAEEIEKLYNKAVENDAQVQSALRDSNRTGGRFFILLDPDGNWVQVFGPAE